MPNVRRSTGIWIIVASVLALGAGVWHVGTPRGGANGPALAESHRTYRDSVLRNNGDRERGVISSQTAIARNSLALLESSVRDGDRNGDEAFAAAMRGEVAIAAFNVEHLPAKSTDSDVARVVALPARQRLVAAADAAWTSVDGPVSIDVAERNGVGTQRR